MMTMAAGQISYEWMKDDRRPRVRVEADWGRIQWPMECEQGAGLQSGHSRVAKRSEVTTPPERRDEKKWSDEMKWIGLEGEDRETKGENAIHGQASLCEMIQNRSEPYSYSYSAHTKYDISPPEMRSQWVSEWVGATDPANETTSLLLILILSSPFGTGGYFAI